MVNKTVELMNRIFKQDPNAVYALMTNRVPCNQVLAEDQNVQVGQVPIPVVYGSDDVHVAVYHVGALGLINGILEVNGLPKIAVRWSRPDSVDIYRKMLGFCELPKVEP